MGVESCGALFASQDLCVHVNDYMYAYVLLHVYVNTDVSIYIYVYIYICIHVCMGVSFEFGFAPLTVAPGELLASWFCLSQTGLHLLLGFVPSRGVFPKPSKKPFGY